MKKAFTLIRHSFFYGAMIVLIGACSSYSLLPNTLYIPNFTTPDGVLMAKQASSSVAEYDLLQVNESMQSYFDHYLPSTMPTRQRARMLVTLLLGSAFLDMKYQADETLTAEQAFLNERANCVGFANLYIALARHYGIDAKYQLITKYPEWNRQEGGDQVMSLSIHINSVLMFPKGHSLVVDATPSSVQKKGRSRIISDATATALFYNNLAINHFSKYEYEQAYRLLVKAISFDKKLDLLWINLGAVFRHNNQLDEAETVYKTALSISPDSFTAMNNLAVLYKRRENWQQADIYLKKTEQYRQRNPYYHFQLALHAEQKNDYSAAVKHLLKAIKLKGDDPEFHKVLNDLYRQSSNRHIDTQLTKRPLVGINNL